jgi:7-cyano-7-deazaguanine synthase
MLARFQGQARHFSSSAGGRTVLLMSGGVESSVLLHQLLAAQHDVYPLFINYHQRGARMEHMASNDIVMDSGNGTLESFDLSLVGEKFQRMNKLHVPLPHRNLPLLSLALSWASANECTNIAIGITKDDVKKGDAGLLNTQTNKLEFLKLFTQIVTALDPAVSVITPQIGSTKPEIIAEGKQYRTLDLSKTYSCMRGAEKHCGSCMQCNARRAAFIEAGADEPAEFYRRQ